MASLLAGTASVTIDGTTYMLEGDMKYMPSTVKRESLVGMDGLHGFKETPVPGSISMSLRDSGGLTVGDFNRMTNQTVVVTLANGKLVTGKGMYTVETQEVDAGDAKFEVKFEGPSVIETPGS